MASQLLPLLLKSPSGKIKPSHKGLNSHNFTHSGALMYRIYSTEFSKFELEGITMLSLLYLHHIQILTIHCFVYFSVTTPSQGSCEKHRRIHPRSLLRSVSMLGKKNPTVRYRIISGELYNIFPYQFSFSQACVSMK